MQTDYANGEVSRTTTDIELHIVGIRMVAAKWYLVDNVVYKKLEKQRPKSTEPWTTPAPTGRHSDELPFIHTHCIIWFRYDLIKATALVLNPYWLLSFAHNSRWSTLSNAFDHCIRDHVCTSYTPSWRLLIAA
jgi:hypothetical protein